MLGTRSWHLKVLLVACNFLILPSAAVSDSLQEYDATIIAQLMAPQGDLPEIVLGASDAKVTIIEFASLTCSHCASFHNGVLPELKDKYINTGKARLIFRDYPGDARALVGSMLLRCLPGDSAHILLSSFYGEQDRWAFVKGSPLPRMMELAKQAGLDEASFNACLADKRLFATITTYAKRVRHELGIQGTPTFFVNGNRMQTEPTLEAFDRAIAEAEVPVRK